MGVKILRWDPAFKGIDDYFVGTGLSVEDLIRQNGPRITSAADLAAKDIPPLVFHVDKVLPEGLLIFAGVPKVGKSYMGLSLCLTVAAGDDFMGKLGTSGASALYLALEDNERRMQARMRALLDGRPVPRVDFAYDWRRTDEGGAYDLADYLEANPACKLVVIDTLERIRPVRNNKNMYAEDYGAMRDLLDVAKSYRVAIVLVHHTRKSEAGDPFDLINGSYGLTGGVDNLWVLTKDGDDGAALHVAGRDIERESYALQRSNSGGWVLRGTLEETRMGDLRRAIVEFLVDEGEPRTSKAISQGIGHKYDTVRSKCSAMYKAGQLSRNGDKYWLPIKDVGGDSGDSANPGDSGDSATQIVCLPPTESPTLRPTQETTQGVFPAKPHLLLPSESPESVSHPDRLKDPHFLDFETYASKGGPATDPDLCTPRLAQHSTGGETTVYDLRDPERAEAFGTALGDRTGTLVAHNVGFELRILERLGLPWRGPIFDTMVASRLIAPHGEDRPTRWNRVKDKQGETGWKYNTAGKHSLEAVADRFLMREMDKSEQKSDWAADMLSDEQLAYARADVEVLIDLVPVMLDELEDVPARVWRQDMELQGRVSTLPPLEVDGEEYARLLESHERAVEDARGRCNGLGVYPVTKAEVDARKPKKRQPYEMSANSAADVKVACGAKSIKDADLRRSGPVGAALADFKKASSDLSKLRDTWGPRASRGWVRPSFKAAGAWTGRMSSSEPNIQQLDKKSGVRRLLNPGDGRIFVAADYSQVEPRVMAALSGDEAASRALNSDDVYLMIADEVGCTRAEAKVMFLGWGYGRSVNTLADALGDDKRARSLVANLERSFPSANARRLEAAEDFAYLGRTDEFTIKRTAMGRPLPCFDYSTSLNCEIQGTAAEMMKVAILAALDRGLDVRMVVHDELVISAPIHEAAEHARMLADCMRDAASSVLPGAYPVEVEMGASYGDLEEPDTAASTAA